MLLKRPIVTSSQSSKKLFVGWRKLTKRDFSTNPKPTSTVFSVKCNVKVKQILMSLRIFVLQNNNIITAYMIKKKLVTI